MSHIYPTPWNLAKLEESYVCSVSSNSNGGACFVSSRLTHLLPNVAVDIDPCWTNVGVSVWSNHVVAWLSPRANQLLIQKLWLIQANLYSAVFDTLKALYIKWRSSFITIGNHFTAALSNQENLIQRLTISIYRVSTNKKENMILEHYLIPCFYIISAILLMPLTGVCHFEHQKRDIWFTILIMWHQIA